MAFIDQTGQNLFPALQGEREEEELATGVVKLHFHGVKQPNIDVISMGAGAVLGTPSLFPAVLYTMPGTFVL